MIVTGCTKEYLRRRKTLKNNIFEILSTYNLLMIYFSAAHILSKNAIIKKFLQLQVNNA